MPTLFNPIAPNRRPQCGSAQWAVRLWIGGKREIRKNALSISWG